MAKAIVTKDEFGALNPVLQSEYAPVEGSETYQLKVDPVNGLQLADVGKLQGALTKERDNVKTMSAKLKAYDGIDVAAARDALEFKTKYDSGELPDDAKTRLAEKEKQLAQKFEDQRKQIEANLGTERTQFKERETKLLTELTDAKVKSVVRAAIASSQGIPELLEPLISSRVKLVEEDGKFVTHVIGDDGRPLLSRKPGSSTEPMPIDEYVGILKSKTEFAGAFRGSGSSGGGSAAGGNSNGNGNNASGGKITLTREQAKDVRTYRAAQEQAKKASAELVISEN